VGKLLVPCLSAFLSVWVGVCLRSDFSGPQWGRLLDFLDRMGAARHGEHAEQANKVKLQILRVRDLPPAALLPLLTQLPVFFSFVSVSPCVPLCFCFPCVPLCVSVLCVAVSFLG
jgi:hypothetical protein